MSSKHLPHEVRVDIDESHSARGLVVLPVFSSLALSESIPWLFNAKTVLRDRFAPIFFKMVKGFR